LGQIANENIAIDSDHPRFERGFALAAALATALAVRAILAGRGNVVRPVGYQRELGLPVCQSWKMR
jgi:hypothetical protein